MIFGHATSTFVVARLCARKPSPWLYIVTICGAYFPDVLDKGASHILGIGTQRGFAHTLLFHFLLLMTGRFLIAQTQWGARHERLLLWFILGSFLHLLEDFLPTNVLFWPLLGDLPARLPITLTDMLYHFYIQAVHPHTLIVELMGHLACLFLLIKDWRARRINHVTAIAQVTTLSLPHSTISCQGLDVNKQADEQTRSAQAQ